MSRSFTGHEVCCVGLFVVPAATQHGWLHIICLIPSLPAQSVYGSGVSSDGTPGVSILAGSLPGVQLMPFHVRDASLPPFTTQQWASLLQRNTSHSISSATSSTGSSDAPGNHSNACTAIVFSAPHFTDVESFLQRLSSVLPNIPVRLMEFLQLPDCCIAVP